MHTMNIHGAKNVTVSSAILTTGTTATHLRVQTGPCEMNDYFEMTLFGLPDAVIEQMQAAMEPHPTPAWMVTKVIAPETHATAEAA